MCLNGIGGRGMCRRWSGRLMLKGCLVMVGGGRGRRGEGVDDLLEAV